MLILLWAQDCYRPVVIMASWLNRQLQRKSPQEVLSSFEADMLKDGVITERLAILRQEREGPEKRVRRLEMIQVVYIVFGVRALIIFMTPIVAPKNTFLPLVLGDSISVMGLAVRQMWYSLCFHYSILYAVFRLTMKWAEDKKHLNFMTDYAPNIWIQSDLEAIRSKLNLCMIMHRMFNVLIYTTVGGTLCLTLVLETVDKRSLPHFFFSVFWALMNGCWIWSGPRLLIPVFFFVWLANREVCGKLQAVNDSGQDILKLLSSHLPKQRTVVNNKIESLLDEFDDATMTITQYNRTLKHLFLVFRFLFMPIAATNCYIFFAGQFPNLLSRYLILILSMSQLVIIYFFMSLAPLPRQHAAPISEVLFSIQSRMSGLLKGRQRVRLLRAVHRIMNKQHPVGYTCGSVFSFESKSMIEFMLDISSCTIMMLQIIFQIQPA